MKGILPILAVLLFSSLIFAHGEDLEEAKGLIDSNVSCDTLDDEQLEAIGDYYMELMHPGEEHELMDQMMGGEGSENLKQMHIRMARRLYCNETFYTGGMMGTGMMDGMMYGNYFGIMGIVWWVFWITLIIVLILLVIWLYKNIIEKKTEKSALDVLKMRYAKGEIPKTEFENMKKGLSEDI